VADTIVRIVRPAWEYHECGAGRPKFKLVKHAAFLAAVMLYIITIGQTIPTTLALAGVVIYCRHDGRLLTRF